MPKSTPIFHNPLEIFNPTPFGFCYTVKTPNKGERVYISGQSGGEGFEHTLNSDFQHQVDIPLANLEVALDAYEISFNDALKITVLIVGHDSEKPHIWSEEMQSAGRQILYQRASQFLYLGICSIFPFGFC